MIRSVSFNNVKNQFIATLERSFLLWEKPFPAGILTALIFFGFATLKNVPWETSRVPYYNYLADAFLQGQLYLRLMPKLTYDLSLFGGKYFLYWGPLPAILIMPFVAIFGVQVSDILQSIAYMGINVGLFALLLRVLYQRGWVQLNEKQRALFVLFFTFGTALTPLPAVGLVWYLCQVASIVFMLLACIVVFAFDNEKAFFWAGFAISAILSIRLSAIFIGIFLAWYLIAQHIRLGVRRLFICCVVGMIPLLITGVLLLLYNQLRFNNPLETGVKYHLMAPAFVEIYKQYGVFSLHYVPINLYLNYTFHPILAAITTGDWIPFGGSLLLLSPLYFAAFYSLWQDRKDWDTWVLLITILLANIPVLMIMAPGSLQFGPRYTLDFFLPLLLLTARGMKRWPTALVVVLAALSILQYLFGTIIIKAIWG